MQLFPKPAAFKSSDMKISGGRGKRGKEKLQLLRDDSMPGDEIFSGKKGAAAPHDKYFLDIPA